jgi:hypothetical protein
MTTISPGVARESWFLPLLTALAAGKLALLVVLGPTLFPDSSLYIGLGQGILGDPSWWRDGGWGEGFAPARLLRPYGYPLLIAGARQLAGENFGLLLATVQSALSLAVLALLGWLARRLIDRQALRAGLLLLCGLSGFTLFDLAVLPDSLYGTLFAVVFILLAAQMLELQTPRLGWSLLMGSLWALSITLRDVALLHSFLPLTGLLLVGWCRGLGWRRTLAHGVVFALPVALLATAVVQWNLFRTGHAFFSITGGLNWLWPSVNMVDRGLADPFTCADAVCQAAKSAPFGRGMLGVDEIAGRLWSVSTLDPISFGKVTFQHFLGVVRAHPLAYVGTILTNLQFGHLADLLFNPVANANELAQMHDAIGHRIIPGTREMWQALRGGAWSQALPLLVMALLSLTTAIGLAITIALAPVRALGAWGERRALVVLYVWSVAAVFLGSYCLVHMEMRHALPSVPLILLAFAWTMDRQMNR